MTIALMFLLALVVQPLAATPGIRTRSASSTSDIYTLVAEYSGATFFDHFTAFTGPDPTSGFVNYTDLTTAAQEQLVGFVYDETAKTTSAYVGVDHTNIAPDGRNSVRITSKQIFNAGSLAVIDIKHIPVQYGLWPAIWMLGTKGEWPASGESDILEYVHTRTYNTMTLHTGPSCTVENSTFSVFQGQLMGTDCNAGQGSAGCPISAYGQDRSSQSPDHVLATAGDAFNAQGGGVYVQVWQEDGIAIWMFPPGSVPPDLVSGKPIPSTWTRRPLAQFYGAGCDFGQSFEDMQIVINIDFCGTWAGQDSVWNSSGAANATGTPTCNEYVRDNPSAFRDSYFDIASIKVYANNGQVPRLVSHRS